MSQHDYDIANQIASNARADLNLALKALASTSSGAAAPTTTFANMIYYNTSTDILYKRNEDDSAWITLGTIDEGLGTFTPSGSPAIATQAEAEAGTNNTKFMTPLRVSQEVGVANSSMVKSALNATSTAPIYACRAFAVFNGQNGSVQFANNITGVSRTAEGQYTITIGTNPPSTSYSVVVTAESIRGRMTCIDAKATGSFKVYNSNADFNYEDADSVSVALFW